jgi:mRNA interferase MazF
MVTHSSYIPERGDIILVNFNPQQGREQAHKRPAVVLSPKSYNTKASLVLVCPITSHVKGYPFEVAVDTEKVDGVILTDQVRSLDWKARQVRFISRLKPGVLTEVIEHVVQLVTE